jgi:hypothetical protein
MTETGLSSWYYAEQRLPRSLSDLGSDEVT